jgi:hypothetical protein
MEELLGNIYSLLDSFYGHPLSEYLWGYNCEAQDYSGDLIYNQIGIIAIIFAIIVPPLYYYVWNPVRNQRIKYWGLMAITAFVNFLIAYFMISSDFENGLIGDCLLYDDKGIPVMGFTNIVMFGFVNALFTAVLFFFFSMIYKWGSKTVKYYPF